MYPQPQVWNFHPGCVNHQNYHIIRAYGNQFPSKPSYHNAAHHLTAVVPGNRNHPPHYLFHGPIRQTNPNDTDTLLTPPLTPTPSVPRSVPSIKKRLLFIRHAEAYHNSLYASGMKNNALLVRDPQLTPIGHNQVFTVEANIQFYYNLFPQQLLNFPWSEG